MNFKEATDGLFDRIDQPTLAKALGVSTALIRQARLKPSASAHRSPPSDWRRVVLDLAEQQRRHYDSLIGRLQEDNSKTSIKRASHATS